MSSIKKMPPEGNSLPEEQGCCKRGASVLFYALESLMFTSGAIRGLPRERLKRQRAANGQSLSETRTSVLIQAVSAGLLLVLILLVVGCLAEGYLFVRM
jgi:hypothetical protein